MTSNVGCALRGASLKVCCARLAPAAVLLVAGLAFPSAGFGGDNSGPAVVSPNGKISIEGGQTGGDGSVLGLGSYSIPLGPTTGAQFDGAFGYYDDEILAGGGVHLFARDPSRYLLGLYGSFHTWNDIDIWRAAGEFELYNGRFSLTGLAGVESVDVPGTSGGATVLNSDDTHFFGQADLSYYLTDDFMVSAGVHYLSETTLGALGVEYLTHAGDTAVSLFANGRFGDDDYQQVSGGVKVYFDADSTRSLIDRHRMQDPINYTPVFPVLTTLVKKPVLNSCTTGDDYASQDECNCDGDRSWFTMGESNYCYPNK